MSRIVTFLVPDNQILFAALGRMAIRHSHLDYVLRMTIKTLTGKTVTEGLAVTKLTQNWRLRRQIDDVATKRFGESSAVLHQLRQLLERARVATTRRNEMLHELWAQELDGGQFLIGDDKPPRPLPTVDEVDALTDEINTVLTALNSGRLDRTGFLLVALKVR